MGSHACSVVALPRTSKFLNALAPAPCTPRAGEVSVQQLVELLCGFKASAAPREREVFACMVHSLFDEYRFFHNYPDKELHTTGGWVCVGG